MKLTAYLSGSRVGWFEQLDSGAIELEYDPVWQRDGGRRELSWSLPKSRRRHRGAAPRNYLSNLLPDNTEVLKRWGTQFGVSPQNPIALLANVGLDAAGAVQLVDSEKHDEPTLDGPGGFEPVTDAELAQHLRELRTDPSAWVTTPNHEGYFSLPGAQAKFTLLQTENGWATPSGTTASTHIVKPGINGFARSDLSEHLTMRAASLLKLNVAASEVATFEDQTAIVVRRFDRITGEDGRIQRLHQEDFAQAAGVEPTKKYQSDGGPGIAAIGRILNEALGRSAVRGLTHFFEATLFNWAALATDAHSKNYALLYGKRSLSRPTFAPLYDLGSALAYAEISDRRAKLAMSYGGHYRADEIQPRHIRREAEAIGLNPDWAMIRARELVVGLPDAFSEAAKHTRLQGDDATFAARLVDQASGRSSRLLARLDSADS